ncbi:MAG: hypothetical protein AAFU64_00475 [Bacteroidota bacterium]
MKYTLFIGLYLIISTAFISKDRTKLLARSWQVVGMQIDGSKMDENQVARQQQNVVRTVLRFTPQGSCYIYLLNREGRVTKKNRWKFADEQTKLIIQPEEGDPQIFFIEKLSAKKMVLSVEEQGRKTIFTYEAVKK